MSMAFTSISEAYADGSCSGPRSMSSHTASSSSNSVSLMLALRVRLEFGRKDEGNETAVAEGGVLNLAFLFRDLFLSNGDGFR